MVSEKLINLECFWPIKTVKVSNIVNNLALTKKTQKKNVNI